MNTTAFVSATPVVARASSAVATSSFTSRRDVVVSNVNSRRATLRMAAGEDKSVPQGFTMFSEQLNGRAAMMGFVIAIATEAMTGQGILGQLESVVKTVENVLPF